MTAPALGYYLGLPAWGFPGWSGSYFPRTSSGAGALREYRRVFNTVEGNTTFYGVPSKESVSRWREAVAGSEFRFTFKLPRAITHERRPDMDSLRQFFSAMEPLDEHMGPLLVQCPASLGPGDLDYLETLFSTLPGSYRYALELRHLDFFERPELVEPLLHRHGAGRVMFDSRPIYHGGASDHPEVLAARHKKPDVPLLDTVYNGLVYARVVLHPDNALNGQYIDEWVMRTRAYLEQGHSVYFMMHCPNNQHCPAFAERFHNALRAAPGPELPPLPPWPLPQQDSLF